jgi:hypothetical protein
VLDELVQRPEWIGLPAQLASYQGGQAALRGLLRGRAALDGALGAAVDFLCLERHTHGTEPAG